MSVIDALEQINAETSGPVPDRAVLPLETALVTLWKRKDHDVPAKGRGRSRLLAPDGEQLIETEYEIELIDHKSRRNITNLVGFPYKGTGRYEWITECEGETTGQWHEVSRLSVEIEARGQSPATRQ